MWALRRASFPLRKRGFNVRVSCLNLMPNTCVEDDAGIVDSHQVTNGGIPSLNTCYHSGTGSLKFTFSKREFSSQASVSDTKEEDDDDDDDDDDDLEEGFSELEDPVVGEKDKPLSSNTEQSDESEDDEEPCKEAELSDAEIDDESTGEKSKLRRGRVESELFKEIVDAPGLAIHSALDKWVKQGKELNRQEISLAMHNLRNRKMYGRALQFSEWLESKKQLEFVEKDYATRLALIAKVHSLQKAEVYIETIPESFRGEVIYRTLLANCVSQANLKKSEENFSKMKSLGFPITAFACNELLILYMKNDKNKIADVLLMMESENIKPSPLTFKILIDAKGQCKDIAAMEQIVDKMKAEGFELDTQTKAVLAGHYISAGLHDKAETLLKKMEGIDLKGNSYLCRILLPLYARLGKVDEVARVWKVCETRPRIEECLAAIEAWGKLNKIEEAEAVFEMMSKKWKLSSMNCSVLLRVYANHDMLLKGKELVKRMGDSGCRLGPLTWDALVKLYVRAGEVEKAYTILQKAVQQSHLNPMASTYMTILGHYAKKGDIHNSEKVFYKMKQAGYASRPKVYRVLIEAYINAKLPAYGIRDRIRADNVVPNRTLANMLIQVDGFRKHQTSDLLE